jgi:DNA replication licensing factor MCM6
LVDARGFFLGVLRYKEPLDAAEPFYDIEMEAMRSRESTTMYVDFAHVMRFNDVLQKAISEEYLR